MFLHVCPCSVVSSDSLGNGGYSVMRLAALDSPCDWSSASHNISTSKLSVRRSTSVALSVSVFSIC